VISRPVDRELKKALGELRNHLDRMDERLNERRRRSDKTLLREFEVLQGKIHGAVRDTLANARVELGRLDYEPAEITMRLGSARTVQRLQSCAKEPWTVAWIEKMSERDVLYDIGANVGAYALVAARKPKRPVGTIVAFEPAAPTYAVLCENVALNNADGAVIPLPVTLGRETSIGAFRYRDLEAGSASHESPTAAAGAFDSVLTQRVMVYRLDDLVSTFGLPLPTRIKLDVDGAELAVLDGAHELLKADGLRSIMVEVHADESSAVDEKLREAGFASFRKLSPPAEDRSYWYALYGRTDEDVES
jgi:FkbM family methyltransferase